MFDILQLDWIHSLTLKICDHHTLALISATIVDLNCKYGENQGKSCVVYSTFYAARLLFWIRFDSINYSRCFLSDW